MAPSLADGVPGLEGIWTLAPPGADTFALNDWMDPATGRQRAWTNQLSHSFLTGITGLHDKPDADDPRVSLVFQQGELPLPRFQRGRTITYSGIIVGETLSDMRNRVAALRAAVSNSLTNPTAWYVSAQYDSTYDPTGLVFKGWGIPLAFTCDDEQPAPTVLPSPYQRAFDLSFRQSEGRWWVTSDEQYTGTAHVDDGDSAVLSMPGTAPSEPIFTVYGTGSGSSTIVLTNAEVGWTLTLKLAAKLADGDTLTIDFGQRLITYLPAGGPPTDDYTGFVEWSDSNAWDENSSAWTLSLGGSLQPGDNTLTVTGDKWEAAAVPAVW